jgi:hypothetical protein
MVERVARAMAPMFAEAGNYWCNGVEWTDCPPATCQCRRMAFEAARAAIAAMREPTTAMQNAGWREIDAQGFSTEDTEVAPIYRAMIDAALGELGKGGVIERTEIP